MTTVINIYGSEGKTTSKKKKKKKSKDKEFDYSNADSHVAKIVENNYNKAGKEMMG
tara:strand:+ start:355 stop:522 length:168 start_codon:yes stop_codon:yes gene_type:complete